MNMTIVYNYGWHSQNYSHTICLKLSNPKYALLKSKTINTYVRYTVRSRCL